MKTNLSPTQTQDRIIILDIYRGFAIFGILIVNMMWFNSPITSLISANSIWTGPADIVTRFLITFFFEGKFYVLFSMLFGYGFWLFMNKESSGRQSISGTYARRLLILLFIGIIHVLFFWPGDILVFYALLGFVLMLFRKAKNRTLIIWAVVFLMIPVFFLGLAVLISLVPEAKQAMDVAMQEQDRIFVAMIERTLTVYQEGSFFEIVRMRFEEYTFVLSGVLFFHVNIIAMFLLGQYAARKGYIQNVKGNLPFFRRLCMWGFIIGIPANLFTAWASIYADIYNPNPTALAAIFVSSFGGPALTLAYVSGLAILLQKAYLVRMSRWFAAVGRMALTNYLLHSIIASFIFMNYGLGLYGKVAPWQGLILVFIIYGLQIPFSIHWLKRYRFGPVEWLWRSLTYMKWQKLKR